MPNREVSDIIEKALQEVIPTFEEFEEGDMLVEWVVVGYVTNPNSQTDSYPQLYSNGTIPRYRAEGLLRKGLRGLYDED